VIIRESLSIHTADRHRFPVRTGGIKDYLDATAILLLAREKGLEFAAGHLGTAWSPIKAKADREEVVKAVAEHFISALSNDKAIVRVEALKNLEAALYRYRFEDEPGIMESLISLSKRLSEQSDGRPLDLLRSILLQAPEEARQRWAHRVRDTALSVYVAARSPFSVQQSLNILGEFSEIEDLDRIVSAITTWPKDRYAYAKPLNWLYGLKSKGHLFEVQRTLVGALAEVDAPEIVERLTECLEHVRRS
jgi:hypothetical protein